MYGYYKLKGHEVVPAGDDEFPMTGVPVIKTEKDGYFVSTVFLGMDHKFGGDGPPLVFETMVFEAGEDSDNTGNDLYCDRYSTWKEAEAGHIEACKKFLTSYTEDDLFLDLI